MWCLVSLFQSGVGHLSELLTKIKELGYRTAVRTVTKLTTQFPVSNAGLVTALLKTSVCFAQWKSELVLVLVTLILHHSPTLTLLDHSFLNHSNEALHMFGKHHLIFHLGNLQLL